MIMSSSLRVCSAGSNDADRPSNSSCQLIQPRRLPSSRMMRSSVGQSATTSSTLWAFSRSTMATVASARLTRYSMSWGVRSVVAGMGITPAFIMPSMATYHSGTRGPMKKARSPLPTPSPASRLANLLDCTLRSQ